MDIVNNILAFRHLSFSIILHYLLFQALVNFTYKKTSLRRVSGWLNYILPSLYTTFQNVKEVQKKSAAVQNIHKPKYFRFIICYRYLSRNFTLFFIVFFVVVKLFGISVLPLYSKELKDTKFIL